MSDRNQEKFDAMKPYLGKAVTLHFPEKGGWQYGKDEAILEKCTINYVNLRRPAMEVKLELPMKIPGLEGKSYKVPEQAASIPLEHLTVAEDMEKKRVKLIFDQSFWKSD